MVRSERFVVPALVHLAAGLCIATAAGAQSRRLTFGKATELLRDVELNSLGDVAFGREGVAYVLDLTNIQVFALDSLGRPMWRVGRKGDGPGEFRVTYHLAARPTGGVAVLDWGNGRVTLLSKAGRVDRSLQLPFSFTQIDGMLILPDGRFVIAAMTGGAREGSDASIHVFSDSLQYQSSFGPLAAAVDTASVRYVGSGGITFDRQRRILFTPKRPFDILRFGLDGHAVERVSIGIALKYDLGDYIAVERSGNRVFKTTTAKTRLVEVPAPFVELPGGGFLGGRGTFETTTIDLVSSKGHLEASVRNPSGCVQILGIDAERGFVYCRALRDDVPALLRLPFRIEEKQ